MKVDHAALGVGGDHKTVMLALAFIRPWQLSDRRAENGRAIAVADQVGLPLRAAFVHPLEPVVDRAYRPVWPDLPEERPVGDLFDPGIDGGDVPSCPVRPPSPAHGVDVQRVCDNVEGSLSDPLGLICKARSVV